MDYLSQGVVSSDAIGEGAVGYMEQVISEHPVHLEGLVGESSWVEAGVVVWGVVEPLDEALCGLVEPLG